MCYQEPVQDEEPVQNEAGPGHAAVPEPPAPAGGGLPGLPEPKADFVSFASRYILCMRIVCEPLFEAIEFETFCRNKLKSGIVFNL